ncbi:uncharacterized protein HD556DRAFT_811318 [Suillus plorans]|uniref:Uncharacterized protein n=1 Tax=Suillus plorans TaxID=116603 RepID=A0A9P7J4G4_9AGAM|nr:uncharacterized protein HD556DRAFT_811318 [Suillus plorans]KAG1802287.1 hypothetical protein HD556DRAFT_811318 [Suillus plorans]
MLAAIVTSIIIIYFCHGPVSSFIGSSDADFEEVASIQLRCNSYPVQSDSYPSASELFPAPPRADGVYATSYVGRGVPWSSSDFKFKLPLAHHKLGVSNSPQLASSSDWERRLQNFLYLGALSPLWRRY